MFKLNCHMNGALFEFKQLILFTFVPVALILLSIPTLYILKLWVYDTTFKKIRNKGKKKHLAEKASQRKLFFILERRKIRAPKRYVVYFYGYLLIVVVLVFFAWLGICNVYVNSDIASRIWTLKLLLDLFIGATYLRQTRH